MCSLSIKPFFKNIRSAGQPRAVVNRNTLHGLYSPIYHMLLEALFQMLSYAFQIKQAHRSYGAVTVIWQAHLA